MSLRPVVLIFGIVGLIAAGYLMLSGPSRGPLHLPEPSIDGPLFAIAIAFVSVLLFVMAREPRRAAD